MIADNSKTGFTKLGLQYYFTAGEKEIRCWTVPRGCLAPQAGKCLLSTPLSNKNLTA